MDWTEIIISVKADDIDEAGDIAHMIVPYGLYIEDYRFLEQDAMEIAHIDLIDEELLNKDRTKGLIHVYIPTDQSPTEAISFLSERLSAQGIWHDITSAQRRNEDWENNWKEFFKPFPVGHKLFIRPVWEELSLAQTQGRTVLSIEPGLAFGNGSHETTKLCLEALEPYIKADTSMLDIGCGSGILSVAGLLLGAERALGVDIDDLAVKTARENGILNGLSSPRYNIVHGNLLDKVDGSYDIVVANIVADAIITLSKDVAKFLKPEGVFIVSGIIDLRAQEVLVALEDAGFDVFESRQEAGWFCFEARL